MDDYGDEYYDEYDYGDEEAHPVNKNKNKGKAAAGRDPSTNSKASNQKSAATKKTAKQSLETEIREDKRAKKR